MLVELRVIEAQFEQLVSKLTTLLDQHANDPNFAAEMASLLIARDKASVAAELVRRHLERHQ